MKNTFNLNLLLNPVAGAEHEEFTPSFIEVSEPFILSREIEQAIKTSPKNKAPGIDL